MNTNEEMIDILADFLDEVIANYNKANPTKKMTAGKLVEAINKTNKPEVMQDFFNKAYFGDMPKTALDVAQEAAEELFGTDIVKVADTATEAVTKTAAKSAAKTATKSAAKTAAKTATKTASTEATEAAKTLIEDILDDLIPTPKFNPAPGSVDRELAEALGLDYVDYTKYDTLDDLLKAVLSEEAPSAVAEPVKRSLLKEAFANSKNAYSASKAEGGKFIRNSISALGGLGKTSIGSATTPATSLIGKMSNFGAGLTTAVLAAADAFLISGVVGEIKGHRTERDYNTLINKLEAAGYNNSVQDLITQMDMLGLIDINDNKYKAGLEYLNKLLANDKNKNGTNIFETIKNGFASRGTSKEERKSAQALLHDLVINVDSLNVVSNYIKDNKDAIKQKL